MNIIKKLVLFLICLIIICFILEFYFRASGISLPGYFYNDLKSGSTLIAGREIFNIGPDKFCIDKVNKYGYIGNGYPNKKDPGTIRIALLGNSFIEGNQVFRRNRFSTILQDNLSEKTERKVEILNLGIFGANLKDEYFKYIRLGADSYVDYFIFFVDSTGMSKERKIAGPDFYLEKDSLKISYTPLHKNMQQVYETFRLISYTALGNLVRGAYNIYYEGILPSIIFGKLYPSDKKGQSPSTSNPDRYILINKKIIDNLAQQNKISANRIIIVKRDNFPRLYENYFKNRNFPYIDLYTFINQNGGQEKLCYWKAGNIIAHWNNLGHKLIGKFLAGKIYDLIKTDSVKKPLKKI
jgi:hypothetical protein